MKKAHRSEFLKAVKDRFPEIRSEINKEDGLLTFEVAVFIKFIQRKVDESEKAVVIDAFNILNEYYIKGNESLNQIIRNAVCEDLDLSDTSVTERHWAFEMLPEPLKTERRSWFEFMGYQSE
ncbi:hypothetical protein R50073_45830 [Maricurvus nonylphenolicus]|uniref:DUF7674 family protein n=1 Tax=Maricurvus nonylphenolicus TaxID=1008307 RepID=UPI0036F2FEF5